MKTWQEKMIFLFLFIFVVVMVDNGRFCSDSYSEVFWWSLRISAMFGFAAFFYYIPYFKRDERHWVLLSLGVGGSFFLLFLIFLPMLLPVLTILALSISNIFNIGFCA
jgi:hypothetical protein